MTVEFRWGNAGGWGRLSGMGDIEAVRAYLQAKHPRRKGLEVRELRRAPGRPSQGKTAIIQLRVTPEQKELLVKLAAAHGCTLTDFLLHGVHESRLSKRARMSLAT